MFFISEGTYIRHLCSTLHIYAHTNWHNNFNEGFSFLPPSLRLEDNHSTAEPTVHTCMWIQMLLQVSPPRFFMCKHTWLQLLAQCVTKHSAQGEKHLNNDSFLVKVTIWCNIYTILLWSTPIYALSHTHTHTHTCVYAHTQMDCLEMMKLCEIAHFGSNGSTEVAFPTSRSTQHTLKQEFCAHIYGLPSGLIVFSFFLKCPH